MKSAPFSSSTKLDKMLLPSEKKEKRNIIYNKSRVEIIAGGILIRQNKGESPSSTEYIYIVDSCIIYPGEKCHIGAIVSTKVNSCEANSSPLTLHCHCHGDTPLSSLRRKVNHCRKLHAVLSP